MNKNYLKFLRKSRNQHSVHSPFVFCLLTKGLYSKTTVRKRYRKKDVFLSRLMQYFKPVSCYVMAGSEGCYKAELKGKEVYIAPLDIYSKTVDVVLLNSSSLSIKNNVDEVLQMMHNDSILIVDRRIKTVAGEQMWKAIVASEDITVSIEFYYFGVAFIRSEQLKQHFVLRM